MTIFVDAFSPGVRAETSTRVGGGQDFEAEGLRGLKALGVRELSYKLAFLACHVAPTNPRVRNADMQTVKASIPIYHCSTCPDEEGLINVSSCCSLVGRSCVRRSRLLRASRAR